MIINYDAINMLTNCFSRVATLRVKGKIAIVSYRFADDIKIGKIYEGSIICLVQDSSAVDLKLPPSLRGKIKQEFTLCKFKNNKLIKIIEQDTFEPIANAMSFDKAEANALHEAIISSCRPWFINASKECEVIAKQVREHEKAWYESYKVELESIQKFVNHESGRLECFRTP